MHPHSTRSGGFFNARKMSVSKNNQSTDHKLNTEKMSLQVVKKWLYLMIISSLLYIHGENEGALKTFKFVIYGDTVQKSNKTFTCKYAVIRRDDMTVIAEMYFFPDCNRSLMYRDGRYVRFLPMLQNDILTSSPTFALRDSGGGFPLVGDD